MTPAGEVIAAEIRQRGPIPFSRFMELALYHPEHGYYMAGRGPFGREGDFYTAAQLQPVFGRLIASWIRSLRGRLGNPAGFRVVEWGAGRGDMAPFLSEFDYCALDVARGTAPSKHTGVIFANELFDALPVDAVRISEGEARQMLVDTRKSRFVWHEGESLQDEWARYFARFRVYLPSDEECWIELPVRLGSVLKRMATPLERGFLVAVDYGYTEREIVRHPRGTLMSYRRHLAVEDVLDEPGSQDITAHVPFTFLEEAAKKVGLHPAPLESMQRALMRCGEADQFASALAAEDEAEAARLRLQLKTLLFGMGEVFRCAVFEK